MRHFLLAMLSVLLLAGIPGNIHGDEARTDAVVSTGWLADHLTDQDLVVLDVRAGGQYGAGHIPGSVNVPAFPNFFINMPGGPTPWMEVPAEKSLLAAIGNAGIGADTTVVIVAQTGDSPTTGPGIFGLTQAARAAVTLGYAGVRNVAILDGGFDLWQLEKREVSRTAATPAPRPFAGAFRKGMFVSRKYVEERIGKAVILDTRDADSYFGLETDMSSPRAGHIPTAKLLPAPWLWSERKTKGGRTECVTWKNRETVLEMTRAILGKDKNREIIVYCGVGGYASPAYFMLTRVAGYANVKFYDGSMQEWAGDPGAPLTLYRYE